MADISSYEEIQVDMHNMEELHYEPYYGTCKESLPEYNAADATETRLIGATKVSKKSTLPPLPRYVQLI